MACGPLDLWASLIHAPYLSRVKELKGGTSDEEPIDWGNEEYTSMEDIDDGGNHSPDVDPSPPQVPAFSGRPISAVHGLSRGTSKASNRNRKTLAGYPSAVSGSPRSVANSTGGLSAIPSQVNGSLPSSNPDSMEDIAAIIADMLSMHRQQIREVADIQKEETKVIAQYTMSSDTAKAFDQYVASMDELLTRKIKAASEIRSLLRRFAQPS